MGGGAMEISSTAFKDGEKIPIQYVMPGAGGKNISIPLTWKNVPPGTKSFALSIVDPHPVAQNWVHWFVINIPPQVSSLEEGALKKKMPSGSVESQKFLWRCRVRWTTTTQRDGGSPLCHNPLCAQC